MKHQTCLLSTEFYLRANKSTTCLSENCSKVIVKKKFIRKQQKLKVFEIKEKLQEWIQASMLPIPTINCKE